MTDRLPRRPRSHQLETLSRARFAAQLPDHLEFKENPPPEYGIDGWVEAFDKEDYTTLGLRFDIQIKATDEPDLTKALKVRLKSTTINYFLLLDRPVLIVVHHSPTDEFYVEWFHSTPVFGIGTDQKTVAVNCANARLLDDDVADALVSEAAAYQNFKVGLQMPVAVSISVESASAFIPLELILALRAAGVTVQDLVVFDDVQEPGKVNVAVGRAIHVDLGGVATTRLERGPDEASASAEETAADILLGLAVAFSTTGHFEQGARLAELAIPTSVWSRDHDLLTHVTAAFIGCRRVEAAMKLATASAAAGHFEAAVHLTWVGLFVGPMTDEEHSAFVRAHDAIREAAEAVGNSNQVSSSYYSMANAYRSRRKHLLAIRHYRLAARTNPGYLQRPYYWREVGGVLYLADKPKFSARAYSSAIALGEDTPLNRGLLGDALMMSGSYEEALSEFELAGDEDPNWVVKRYAMRRLLARGIARQKRETGAAEEMVASVHLSDFTAEEMIEACEEAIKLDAMSGLAWFNLGVAVKDDLAAALEPFTLAAVAQEGDVEAWWNSCIASMDSNVDPTLSTAIWAAAIRLNGDEILRMASQWARQSGMEMERRREFMAFVEDVAEGVVQRDTDPVIRISTLGPEYDELTRGLLADNKEY